MHEPDAKTGVLLVNLGSPDAPTRRALRRYLKQFLSDPRVVNLPRVLWWVILHGIVLPFRSGKSAKAYRQIWTADSSPLVFLTQQLAQKLAVNFQDKPVVIDFAMRYGKPSIGKKLTLLKQAGVGKIIVLPLYPQYSSTTTASVFDKVIQVLTGWRHIPSLDFISDYHRHPAYIAAMATSIRRYWQENGQHQLLLMSFHGLPARLTTLGDPYYHQCQITANLIAKALNLTENQWKLVFQSRFGKAEWLKPYCIDVLQALPGEGVTTVDVVCPGFPVDCLETLEEIAITNKQLFIGAGGTSYRYIPALNDSDLHIECLLALLENNDAGI